MTQRTRDADRTQPIAFEEALHADDGVELQQCQRDRGIVEVDSPLPKLGQQLLGQRCDIDFQPEANAMRGEVRPDATEALALHRLMELQRAAPEGLVAERIVAERAPAFEERTLEMFDDSEVEGCNLRFIRRRLLGVHRNCR